jgi:urease accessory protein
VKRNAAALAAVLLCVSLPALAHDLSDRYGAYLGAAIHPLTELDHLLAFVAIGLLAGQQGAPRTWRALAAFLTGLALGLAGAALPGVASGALPAIAGGINLLSFTVLGLLVVVAPRLPGASAAAIAALFGATHGFENGIDLGGALGVASALGVLTAALAAAGPAAALVNWLTRDWQRIAVRVVGSWIAAIGLLMLALQFRS